MSATHDDPAADVEGKRVKKDKQRKNSSKDAAAATEDAASAGGLKASNADAIFSLSASEQVQLLSEALLREYMHKRGFKRTLQAFDVEHPRDEHTISSRQLMSKLLLLESKMKESKEAGDPFHTFMEVLCSYRLHKRDHRAHAADGDGDEVEDSSDEERNLEAAANERDREIEEANARIEEGKEAYRLAKERRKSEKRKKHHRKSKEERHRSHRHSNGSNGSRRGSNQSDGVEHDSNEYDSNPDESGGEAQRQAARRSPPPADPLVGQRGSHWVPGAAPMRTSGAASSSSAFGLDGVGERSAFGKLSSGGLSSLSKGGGTASTQLGSRWTPSANFVPSVGVGLPKPLSTPLGIPPMSVLSSGSNSSASTSERAGVFSGTSNVPLWAASGASHAGKAPLGHFHSNAGGAHISGNTSPMESKSRSTSRGSAAGYSENTPRRGSSGSSSPQDYIGGGIMGAQVTPSARASFSDTTFDSSKETPDRGLLPSNAPTPVSVLVRSSDHRGFGGAAHGGSGRTSILASSGGPSVGFTGLSPAACSTTAMGSSSLKSSMTTGGQRAEGSPDSTRSSRRARQVTFATE